MKSTELWKPVSGYDGLYEVSNLGRVKSLARTAPNGRIMPEIIRSLYIKQGPNPYRRVTLCHRGTKRVFSVHRLVAEAFIPNQDGLPEVNHIDCDEGNNRADNLEWVTSQENSDHKRLMGRIADQSKANNGNAKLDQIQVDAIRKMRSSGMKLKQIAPHFGVTFQMVSKICLGHFWKD